MSTPTFRKNEHRPPYSHEMRQFENCRPLRTNTRRAKQAHRLPAYPNTRTFERLFHERGFVREAEQADSQRCPMLPIRLREIHRGPWIGDVALACRPLKLEG